MDLKKILKKLLFPPIWAEIVLTVLSAAGLIWVFLDGREASWFAYPIYVLAFYTLCVVSLFCALVLPKRYRAIKEKIYAHPLGNRYLTDRVFRIHVSLTASFAISMLYAGVNLWSWHTLKSYWFLVLAVYYGILSVMRFLLMRYVRVRKIGTDKRGEWKRSRVCAGILLLVNLSLSGAVLMILFQNRGYDYPGMMIYVMAMFTFYSAVHAIVDIVKYRRLGSPVMTTAKIVSLSAALVSMLNLETAMFAQFGAEMRPEDQRLFIILTGAGVSITVVALSTLLMVRATKVLKNV